MEILIDALAASDTPGGGYRYVYGLASGLQSFSGLSVTLLTRRGSTADWSGSGARTLPVDAPTGSRRLFYEWRHLRRLVGPRFDVFHFPHEWVPPGIDAPTVITWQNVAHIADNRRGTRAARNATYRLLQRSAPRAARIIAVSKLWHERLRHRFGDLVRYVPEGCTFDDGPTVPSPSQSRWLLVGGDASYKNVDLGIRAFLTARARGMEHELHVVGLHNGLPDSRSGHDSIVDRGWLEHHQLRQEMEVAEATLFPSRIESFGLPALESLEASCPVIVLRTSTMHREFGELVNPVEETVGSISDALIGADFQAQRRMLRSPEVRAKLRSRYSWEEVARATIAIYAEAAGSGSL